MDEPTGKAAELVTITFWREAGWEADFLRARDEIGPEEAPEVITRLVGIASALLRFGAEHSGQEPEPMLQNIALALAELDEEDEQS